MEVRRPGSVMASAAEGFDPLSPNQVVAKLRWVLPAAQLDGPVVQKPSEPKGRGLLDAGKIVLLVGEPGQFRVGDDTARDGFEEKRANRKGVCYGM